jgi:hypothetical protein
MSFDWNVIDARKAALAKFICGMGSSCNMENTTMKTK